MFTMKEDDSEYLRVNAPIRRDKDKSIQDIGPI